MYNARYTGTFYDVYGTFEWDRLEATAYGRLQAIIHTDFIQHHIRRGDRVLDAGCGPGRFTAVMAKLGATVTALDLSGRQLELARESIRASELMHEVTGFVQGDITDLSAFPDGHFDALVCYGGALSYVCELRERAAAELVRIVRPGGMLLISVMSRHGMMANMVRLPMMSMLRDPEGWRVWRISEDGDLSGVPSRAGMEHPPMHLFTGDELRCLLPDCSVLELAGSNVATFEGSTTIEEVASDEQAWATAINIERELNTSPGLVESGSHIIMVAQRNSA